MKAYQIKIYLEESNPLIWRRVIIPAGITFNRFHDIIQSIMGWKNNYYYDFNIKEEKLRITNDEERVQEYESYLKRKLDKGIKDPYGYIARMLEITTKLSNNVKIDKYLTTYKKLEYIYDFGDYWIHKVILEDEIDDYGENHPICISGEEACPPEDIGGLKGYEQFISIINDASHPSYQEVREWASVKSYCGDFDIDKTNLYMSCFTT